MLTRFYRSFLKYVLWLQLDSKKFGALRNKKDAAPVVQVWSPITLNFYD